MEEPLIIGLNGPHGVGKTTIARDIAEQRSVDVMSFSSVIKDIAVEIDPKARRGRLSSLVDDHGWRVAKNEPDIRTFLNDLGSVIRTIDPSYIVDYAVAKARASLSAGIGVVFDDVYLSAEAQAIHRLGGVVVDITRVGVEHHDDAYSQHIPSDAVVENVSPGICAAHIIAIAEKKKD